MVPMNITLRILFTITSIFAFGQKESFKSSITVITHVGVIDGTGSGVQPDMTLVIDGNRIISIDKSLDIEIPKNVLIINGSGKYIIPGLWDMHVHIFNNISETPLDENDFSLFIANGITGIREMWTKPTSMQMVNQLRDQFNKQPGSLPRFGAVGTMVDGPPPIRRNSDTASTEAEARLIVHRIKEAGVDFVKVYDGLSRTVYFAISDEARKLQIPIAGHVPEFVLLREAADAGQISIEHMTGSLSVLYDDSTSIAKMGKNLLPDSITARSPYVPLMQQDMELNDQRTKMALYQHLAVKGVWQCPTLVIYKRYSTDSALMFSDMRLKYISSNQQKDWNDKTGGRIKDRSNQAIAEFRSGFQRLLNEVLLMKKAGVQFLAGSDFDNDFIYAGFSLHDELALFVEAGFSPMEALQTATINPAKFLGISDSLGTIEKGKIADMVLLDANPLANIQNTQQINAVFVNGKYLSKEILQAKLSKVEKSVRNTKE
jgi:imidazolonepropionase-like amidohydrolase